MGHKISIVIPIHWMENWQFFLIRCLESIESQTFTDYEIIITKHGKMAENTNAAIKSATGELVKILYMDDYFAHPDSLKDIVENFKGQWLVTGCLHQRGDEVPHSYHSPHYSDDIYTGNNCIGSPSVVTFKREGCLYFDEKLSFLLDCDLYKRMFEAHGPPTIFDSPNVVIGLHDGQTSERMPMEEKQKEFEYTIKKHS